MQTSRLLKFSSNLVFTPMYFSTFTTQAELVYHLKASNIVKSPSVIAAFCSVDRKNYCVSNYPYIDIPQTIGCDQTISAPHMHGYALQLLSEESSRPNAKILDVGCGSGYLTALFARFNPSATVVGIDCFEELVELSRQNIMKEDRDLLDSGQVQLHHCDGWSGYKAMAPYDVIHVGASANSIPDEFLRQLKVHGRMLIPVGRKYFGQELLMVDRERETPSSDVNLGDYKIRAVMHVSFVPLIK